MRSRHHAQCMHALQPHALVGGAALVNYRGRGLIGGRRGGGSNEQNKLPRDPPLICAQIGCPMLPLDCVSFIYMTSPSCGVTKTTSL